MSKAAAIFLAKILRVYPAVGGVAMAVGFWAVNKMFPDQGPVPIPQLVGVLLAVYYLHLLFRLGEIGSHLRR